MPEIHVEVDESLCGGHGECVVAAPGVFDFVGDDDVVTVRQAHPPAEHQDAVLDAEARCPNAAIRVSER